jgi:hypothetical protein
MFINDFDSNGQREPVIAYKRKNEKLYPLASKDELGKQMPSIIHKKYTTYKDFSGQTISEIFPAATLDTARQFIVNQFASLYFENTGNGTFIVKELPVEAQLSKIFAIYSTDFDDDGNIDVLLGGNSLGGSAYQSTYDGSYGLLMKGDGKGGFAPLSNRDSGVSFEGLVRDIKPIVTDEGAIYLISKNNSSLQMIKKNLE